MFRIDSPDIKYRHRLPSHLPPPNYIPSPLLLLVLPVTVSFITRNNLDARLLLFNTDRGMRLACNLAERDDPRFAGLAFARVGRGVEDCVYPLREGRDGGCETTCQRWIAM